MQDAPRAASVAFANTAEALREKILGREAFERGRPGHFDRTTNTGSRVAVAADYAGALRIGHTVRPVIHEVFGGWAPDAVRLFRQLAAAHRDALPAAQRKWGARTFTAFHAQRISTAIHLRSAEEIYRNYQHEAAISDTGRRGGRPHMMQAGTRRGRA